MAIRAPGISDHWYRSLIGVIVIRVETHQSTRENLGCTWECRRTNEGITNTLWDMLGWLWILIWRTAGYLTLSGITRPINFLQLQTWRMDHCSLSLLNQSSYHLLQHSIFCLATLWNQRKWPVIRSYMLVHWKIPPTTRSKDINWTWCQCHPLHLPTHQGGQYQEHTLHEWDKDSADTPWICWLFIPGKWMI